MFRRTVVAALAVAGTAWILFAATAAAETVVFSAANRAFSCSMVVMLWGGSGGFQDLPCGLDGRAPREITFTHVPVSLDGPPWLIVVRTQTSLYSFEGSPQWIRHWRGYFPQEMSKDLMRFDLVISEAFTRPLHVPVLILRGPEDLDNIHFFPSWMKIPPLTPHDPTLRSKWLSTVEQKGYRVHPFYKSLYQVRE
ncbi:MAG: hypothetical protein Q8R13_00620 [bacterium]|nr:hypothetical protein [bacterium]MDZ4295819.1 hypothetical protein [Patescibacteria group bacterium]